MYITKKGDVMDQNKFIQTVEKIKIKADENNRMISVREVNKMLAGEGMNLNNEQLKMVYAFLKTSKITLTDESYEDWIEEDSYGFDKAQEQVQDDDAQKSASDDRDAEFVKMYQEDLSSVCVLDDEQILSVMKKIILNSKANEEVKSLKEMLIKTYLKNVVSWLKDYNDTAVLMSDLIQEGNMALMETIDAFDYEEAVNSNNPVRKLKDHIRKNVVKAARDSIYMQESENNVGYKIEGRVNAVNECAKKLSDEYGCKVTIEQVAEEMDMDVEEVKEIVDLSANKIEYINLNNN